MQQNRTFIPGVDENSRDNLYSRKTGSENSQGTFIPGMQEVASSVVQQPDSNQSNIPVVGFLYSISRQGIGEYWPLHLGANTIGRSADCDVRLREMSVSSQHASISIKQMKSTGTLIATIRDVGSRTGMFVNDEELDYESHNCKNGDIITIGTSYKLLLILINAKELGLSVSETFKADNEEDEVAPSPIDEIYNRHQKKNVGGTIDLSGVNQMERGGGTQLM